MWEPRSGSQGDCLPYPLEFIDFHFSYLLIFQYVKPLAGLTISKLSDISVVDLAFREIHYWAEEQNDFILHNARDNCEICL